MLNVMEMLSVCGNEITNGGVASDASDCNMACGGNASSVIFAVPTIIY